MYGHCFEFLKYHASLFEDQEERTTEADESIKAWTNQLETLFRNTAIRCKWGESVGDNSTFKVDLRLVSDTRKRKRNQEANNSNCEVSPLQAPISKINAGRVKVLVESKQVLDKLIEEGRSGAVIAALQLSGLKAKLFSLRLAADGLYVASLEGTATIPTSTSNLPAFLKVAKLLHKFKLATIEIAELRKQVSSESPVAQDEQSGWTREGWVPSANNKAKMQPLPRYFV